jgi:hypothetical protein
MRASPLAAVRGRKIPSRFGLKPGSFFRHTPTNRRERRQAADEQAPLIPGTATSGKNGFPNRKPQPSYITKGWLFPFFETNGLIQGAV